MPQRSRVYDTGSLSIPYSVSIFESVTALPPLIWDFLRSNALESNLIYPHALKTLADEEEGVAPLKHECWITAVSDGLKPSVDFVLACTEGPLGSYPIFIVSAPPPLRFCDNLIRSCLRTLVDSLRKTVPTTRVYSVFARRSVSIAFSELWEETTGISSYKIPYYDANLMCCIKTTFGPATRQLAIRHNIVGHDLRLAREDDVPAVAKLCRDFSQDYAPFALTSERATEEAKILIRKECLWVHAIQKHDGEPEIASIVAVGRDAVSISVITKVFTDFKWRRLGCAERLVRHVCSHLLSSKEAVALYVARDNILATNVYRRVGFTHNGLVDSDSTWLEIGFDRNAVVLGHW